MPRTHRISRRILPVLLGVALLPLTMSVSLGSDADSYRNPLKPQIPNDGTVDSCADPTVLHGQRDGDRNWYMYCTTDPLNDGDTAGDGVDFHSLPMMKSRDLVNWTYVGDALPEGSWPSYAAEDARLWAPDVVYSKTYDKYYLTFVVTQTTLGKDATGGDCPHDNAIGVATSHSPLGPWHASDVPVVPPRQNGPDCNFFWTFDPEVLGDTIGERGKFYYGSYYGGVFGTNVVVTPDGMTSGGTVDDVPVAIPNRYEGANVVRRGDWYYLFASAANCCNGPITGYSVFVGRSRTPFGPFVDREGNSFLDGRVGGTPVLSMNGNKWVGTGHNTVFKDFDGQWWTVYHAVNRFDPYFEGEPGFTKRPALLDPLDWRDGWPSVRARRWASDQRMPAPAAQPGEQSRYRPNWLANDRLGTPIWRLSDTFRGNTLGREPVPWTWEGEPEPAGEYSVENGEFRYQTQPGDLARDTNNAPVLTEPTPPGDYVVQTKVHLNVPEEGCCFNYRQGGLVIYDNDDKYIKLVHVSIWETRQTELAKEVPNPEFEGHSYGNSVIGPPADWTYLRIVKRERPSGLELYTGYTSQDGETWIRGGTWTHRLGDDARIGLVSMGGDGYRARFKYVRVWEAAPR